MKLDEYPPVSTGYSQRMDTVMNFFHTAPARTGAGMKEILMQLGTKEHEDVIAAFEKAFPYGRKDKEPKEHWKNGNVYQNGEYNQLFLAFRHGIAYAQCIERLNQS